MSAPYRFLTRVCGVVGLLVLGQSYSLATTYTFIGPQDANGQDCNPADGHCIIGDPLIYQMFSAKLTTPGSPGSPWTLLLETNYGVPLPGDDVVIPTFPYAFNAVFAMCDFMIEWQGRYFGIVMNAHDGYEAGHLYEVDGFQTSEEVMAAQGVDSPRRPLPALINPGGDLLGVGIIAAGLNPAGDGVARGLYLVEVGFVAPADFLSDGLFRIHACSYVCVNGYITGEANVPPDPGEDETVPEPATWTAVLSGIGAVGYARFRQRKRA